jgi:hypothetical protein
MATWPPKHPATLFEYPLYFKALAIEVSTELLLQVDHAAGAPFIGASESPDRGPSRMSHMPSRKKVKSTVKVVSSAASGRDRDS